MTLCSKCKVEKPKSDFSPDIVVPANCPVLGIPIEYGIGGKTNNSPSLDRFDNSKGYIKSNVRVISHRANTLKSNGTIEEFLKIIEYMRGS